MTRSSTDTAFGVSGDRAMCPASSGWLLDPHGVSEVFATVEEALGPVDVLVDPSGITGSADAIRMHETPFRGGGERGSKLLPPG